MSLVDDLLELTLVENLLDMIGYITDAAMFDPISGVLVASGSIIIGFSVLVMAYLTLGAVIDFVVPDLSG